MHSCVEVRPATSAQRPTGPGGSLTDWLPALVRYPFFGGFGGQVTTVPLVVLVVRLAGALSTSADLLLATAAVGSMLIHSALARSCSPRRGPTNGVER